MWLSKVKLIRRFYWITLSAGSKLMLMEMSPLLYDFAIDVSKQVCLGLMSVSERIKDIFDLRSKHPMSMRQSMNNGND